jgi:L-alanine-DL-glutamate epimerase-like enolase superfamily enzyme
MFGCMIESSFSATAAAQIGALADYLDLDSPLLITNDHFRGVEYERGGLRLPRGPGLGVAPSTAS